MEFCEALLSVFLWQLTPHIENITRSGTWMHFACIKYRIGERTMYLNKYERRKCESFTDIGMGWSV